MPSRPLPPPLTPSTISLHHHGHRNSVPTTATSATAAAAALFLLLMFSLCLRRISRKRTVPSSDDTSKPPHRFSYPALCRSTSSFSPSLLLGQGGFGSVYHGILPDGQNVAVKLMDSGSLQGEREFQNELFFASKLKSPYVITALGFSSDRKHSTMLLVYELMPNGNLQDALLHRKCPELGFWEKRFSLCLDIAKGIEYLHGLDPPVVHGDVKPGNVLLDACFNAKIADFGLAWVREPDRGPGEVKVDVVGEEKGDGRLDVKKGESEGFDPNGINGLEDCGSVVETESLVTTTTTTVTGFEEFNFRVDQSPESFFRGPRFGTSPETFEAVSASPGTFRGAIVAPVSPEGNLDKASVGSGNEGGNGGKKDSKGMNGELGKDWWWKQDTGGPAESGPVKDYVMEWIGTEIKEERPTSDWIGASSSSGQPTAKVDKKKNRKRWDWWVSLDEDKDSKVMKKDKRRPPREWWKEEYCEELEKKKRKKNKKKKELGLQTNDLGGEEWWPQDEALYSERKKKKKKRSRSRSSRGSIDWFSGELFRGPRNSHDSMSEEIPKSGGISSTPSMRGTVCYAAPEYNGGGVLSEKSDVYSFGVLMLVLISGRRPLQVTSSPLSEFQRANLIHWTRHLARAGKLLELIDQSMQSLDRDQALICITVALLCLQKSPSRRPTMKEVVKLLTRKAEVIAILDKIKAEKETTAECHDDPQSDPYNSFQDDKEWEGDDPDEGIIYVE